MRFVIENRSRNRAAMSPLKVYANHARAFTPLSKAFMAHAAMIPFAEKRGAGSLSPSWARAHSRYLIPQRRQSSVATGTTGGGTWKVCRPDVPLSHYGLRLFGRAQDRRFPCSDFFGKHLLEGADRRLNPDVHKHSVQEDNYHAWKWLFHWKAWKCLHEGCVGGDPPAALRRRRVHERLHAR
ncbi:MAG TPA: hypothetical protein VJQ42_02940 [Rhodanobacteraceae bacterium]|nr:hypothetical protein [Rhodanobacteraceae bacterium]